MIEIKTVQSFEELAEIYSRQGVEFTDFCMAIKAQDGENTVGVCLFMLKPDGIYIKDIEPKNDLSLADGVLRSALHVAAFHNVNTAYYESTAPEKLFARLGFILDNDKKTLDINKLYESCCSCDNK